MSSRSRSRTLDFVDRRQAALVIALAVPALVFSGYVLLREPPLPESSRTTSATPTPTPTDERAETVFVGDSVTEGGTTGINIESGAPSWAYKITADPEGEWQMGVNVAAPGFTSEQALAALRDLPPEIVEPEIVFILVGTNDAAGEIPVARVRQNVEQIIEHARSLDADPILVSPPPNDNYTDRVEAVVDVEAATAKKAGVPFIDIFHGLGNSGRWPAPGWTVDGTHPSDRGQQEIADYVLKAIKQQ